MKPSRVRRIVLAAATLGLFVACGDGDVRGGDQGLIPDPPPNDIASGTPLDRLEGVLRSVCDAVHDCVGTEFFDEYDGVEDCTDQTMGELDIDPAVLEVADAGCLDASLRYLACYAGSFRCVVENGYPNLVESEGGCSALEVEVEMLCPDYE